MLLANARRDYGIGNEMKAAAVPRSIKFASGALDTAQLHQQTCNPCQLWLAYWFVNTARRSKPHPIYSSPDLLMEACTAQPLGRSEVRWEKFRTHLFYADVVHHPSAELFGRARRDDLMQTAI